MQREWFGERLKRFREAAGLSQNELARRSGLSTPTISMLESGRRRGVSAANARKLARALVKTVDELLGDSRLEEDDGDHSAAA
jgi:transcriptional regulator with XRE-family HTH domain